MTKPTPRPLFQRRHYEAIAKVLRDVAEGRAQGCLAEQFADMFAADNPYRGNKYCFDRERFLAACGVGEEASDGNSFRQSLGPPRTSDGRVWGAPE